MITYGEISPTSILVNHMKIRRVFGHVHEAPSHVNVIRQTSTPTGRNMHAAVRSCCGSIKYISPSLHTYYSCPEKCHQTAYGVFQNFQLLQLAPRTSLSLHTAVQKHVIRRYFRFFHLAPRYLVPLTSLPLYLVPRTSLPLYLLGLTRSFCFQVELDPKIHT